ncbi:hypothetical protein GMSM_31020 [Geomonas sp. Red276]
MSRYGEELLLKMLRKWEASPDMAVSLPITRSRALSYFEAENLDDKDALHAYLNSAEREEAIHLKWGRLTTAHLVERITLTDGAKLAAFLGLPVASVEAARALGDLRPVVAGMPSWIADLAEEMAEHWRVGKTAHGLAVTQVGEAGELLRALDAVAAGKQEGLDLRTFSARHVGDSKAMERMMPRFSRIWQRQFPGDELDPAELYQSLGLVKFPHPVLFRGPITIRNRGRLFDFRAVRPYLGFPPQSVDGVEFPSLPSYVLFIENPASFNRHVAEVEDEGLVLYTAGFPSSKTLSLIRMLDHELPSGVPFFHWGDLDLGGVRIMARIQDQLQRTLHPHLMTPELLARYGEICDRLDTGKLAALASRHPFLSPLVEAILAHDPPRWLEQENVDPCGPLP